MSNKTSPNNKTIFDHRKNVLITEGAVYRSAIGISKQVVHENLYSERLAQNAMHHLAVTSYSALQNIFNMKALRNGNLEVLLPLLMGGISFLRKKRAFIKPAVASSALIVTVGLATFLTFRWRKLRQSILNRNRLD